MEEAEHVPVFLQHPPVQPAGQIILAVGVVISELGVAELVPRQEHGDAPATHEEGEGVADHPPPESVDFRVVRLPLNSAVPAVVVVGPVGASPAVFFVVFDIVGK